MKFEVDPLGLTECPCNPKGQEVTSNALLAPLKCDTCWQGHTDVKVEIVI